MSPAVASRKPNGEDKPAPANGERHPLTARAELESTFWQIWLSYRGDLLRQSLRLMNNNRADAEDAVSRATLRAFAKYPLHAHTITNPRGWLSRLVHNVCVDWYRQNGARRNAVDGLKPEQHVHLGLTGPEARTPERIVAERERSRSVRRSVATLPAHLREPFVLRFLRDRSYAEIADDLGLSSVNVRKRIQLARAILRDSLGE